MSRSRYSVNAKIAENCYRRKMLEHPPMLDSLWAGVDRAGYKSRQM